MERIVLAATVACWAVLATVWVVAALRERAAAVGHEAAANVDTSAIDDERARGRARLVPVAGGVLVIGAVLSLADLFTSDRFLSGVTIEASWLQLPGLALLAASAGFAVWARLALGSSWSVGPRVIGDRRLRTSGPYAITRHPIYTGILGMLIGTALVSGVAWSIIMVLAGLVIVEAKIRREERLLLATFPDAYQQYRQQVPQLVPGLASLHL